MEPFHYRDGQLYCEDVPAAELAGRFGTPLYVYSEASILGTPRSPSTGKKESTFGMATEGAARAAEAARTIPSLRMIGIHMHIGSQITSTEPYAGAVAKGVELIGRLRAMGHPIAWYNMGGGYGI